MIAKSINIFKRFFIFFIFLSLIQFINCENDEKKDGNETQEKSNIKVSIIIPVYNSAEFIERSLGSALEQTLKEIEVIVVDDHSTDNTLEIINKHKDDPRLRIIALEKNQGAGIARNIGMKAAVGEFIGFIDSDDYADKRFYEFLYKYSKDKDMVNGIFVYGTNLSDKFRHHGNYRTYGGTYDSIWRREFINKYNIKYGEDRKVGEDIVFRSSFMENNPRVAKTPDEGIYYYYKRREGSLMNFPKDYLKNEDNVSYEKESYIKYSNLKHIIIYSAIFLVLFIIVLVVAVKLFKCKNKKPDYNRMEEEETSELIINYN